MRNKRYVTPAIFCVGIFFVGCGTLQTPTYQGLATKDLRIPAEYHPQADFGEGEKPDPMPGASTVPMYSEQRRHDRREDFNFDWPIDSARLSRGFKLAKKSHWGLDLANDKGTPIFASERGRVIYTGRAFKGYGKLIVIEHGERWATLYAHLSKILVKEDDLVNQVQPIAEMGRTGRATGNHLHFELRYDRQPVNPLQYLPQGF